MNVFSYKWFLYDFIYKSIWFVFFFKYIFFIKSQSVILTKIEFKHIVYLQRVYNINKIKWNNYLNKIWF